MNRIHNNRLRGYYMRAMYTAHQPYTLRQRFREWREPRAMALAAIRNPESLQPQNFPAYMRKDLVDLKRAICEFRSTWREFQFAWRMLMEQRVFLGMIALFILLVIVATLRLF